jgi:hypothetical protein
MRLKLEGLRPMREIPYSVTKRGARGRVVTLSTATGFEPGDKVYVYAASTGEVVLSRRRLTRRRV